MCQTIKGSEILGSEIKQGKADRERHWSGESHWVKAIRNQPSEKETAHQSWDNVRGTGELGGVRVENRAASPKEAEVGGYRVCSKHNRGNMAGEGNGEGRRKPKCPG